MLKTILELNGYHVHATQNPKDTSKILKKNNIDLVILDLIMPKMSGEETYHALRQLDPNIPVLLVSGYRDAENVRKLIANGAAGFLEKPFSGHALSQTIAQTIRQDRDDPTPTP